ncbi:MAG: hypothetical protein QOE87_4572 [Gaiellales bacterium]|nr:hypothetical protein [Gaiellales bacterium]
MSTAPSPGAGVVVLENDALAVRVLCSHGGTIASIVDRHTGLDALWQRDRHAPAACTRSLGPAGELSSDSFLELFCGGWFTMFPVVGGPLPNDPRSHLHGEVVRLPWEIESQSRHSLALRVQTVRSPFVLTRSLALESGTLQIDDRITNAGDQSATYLYGHHPCLARATFAGGRLDMTVGSATIPHGVAYVSNDCLEPTTSFTWSRAFSRAKGMLDLADVPFEADGRQVHALLHPTLGQARLTCPQRRRAFTLTWDIAEQPYVLLWEDFRSVAGYPLWGAGDTLAVEFSTNPGRSADDALTAGAFRSLAPGEEVAFSSTAGWSDM